MQVNDAINDRDNLYGKTVFLTGVLYLDRDSQYIVSNMSDLGKKGRGIQVLDHELEKLLLEKVSFWLGGALYQDSIEVTGEIIKSENDDFRLAIGNLTRFKLYRDERSYDILG